MIKKRKHMIFLRSILSHIFKRIKFLFLCSLKWLIYVITITLGVCFTIKGGKDDDSILLSLGTGFLASWITALIIEIYNTVKEIKRKKKIIVYANSSFLEDLNSFIIVLQRIINDIYYEYYKEFNYFKFNNVNIFELFKKYAEKLEDINILAAPVLRNNATTKEEIERERRQQNLIKKIEESEIELEGFRKKFVKHKKDFETNKNMQIVSDIIEIDDYKFLKALYEIFGDENNCSLGDKRKEILAIKNELKEILRLFDFKQFKKLGYKNKYYNNLKGYLDCEPKKLRSEDEI